MGVRMDWRSKNRVHTQFFTYDNPGYGVSQFCGTKSYSLPPHLSLSQNVIKMGVGVCLQFFTGYLAPRHNKARAFVILDA